MRSSVLALRVGLVGGTFALLAAGILVRSHGSPMPRHASFLLARRDALAHQVELARRDRRYLLLDPERHLLNLYQGGTLLRQWPVASVAAGSRRMWIGGGPEREDWRSAVWEGPRLDPPVRRERRVIFSDRATPPDPNGEVDWIPPTPEEETPTPARFVVHFVGRFGLEVVAPVADTLSTRPSIVLRTAAAFQRLSPGSWDRYRVRVVMRRADAGSLYRSLPGDAAFLAILPR